METVFILNHLHQLLDIAGIQKIIDIHLLTDPDLSDPVVHINEALIGFNEP